MASQVVWRRVAEDEKQALEEEMRNERERREVAEKQVGAQTAEIEGLRASLAKSTGFKTPIYR